MSKVNGKTKGNAFERKIANLLSDRFKDYLGVEKGFRRNPDSGSFFGGKNVARVDQYSQDYAIFGDLICPKEFNFSIECKNYKAPPSFTAVLNGTVPEWDKWLLQAGADSEKSGKHMLLIIKYNNVPEFVIVDKQIADLTCRYQYRGNFVYLLSDFLSKADTFYFAAK